MTGTVAVDDLHQRYDTLVVLDGLSLSVAPGELVAVVGPTGCGKSTLLRVLAGLLIPTGGSASIDGTPVIGRPGACGYMPQADTLLPWRRALANATLGAEIRGEDPDAVRERARALFTRFGLAGFEDAWPRELSGGMRQRVALLRTILVGAPVLLLDEPFGALDAITRADLQTWLGGVLTDTPRTTLLVTHDVDEALRLANRIVVMSPRPGRIVTALIPPGPPPRPQLRLTDPDLADVKREVLEALDSRAG